MPRLCQIATCRPQPQSLDPLGQPCVSSNSAEVMSRNARYSPAGGCVQIVLERYSMGASASLCTKVSKL